MRRRTFAVIAPITGAIMTLLTPGSDPEISSQDLALSVDVSSPVLALYEPVVLTYSVENVAAYNVSTQRSMDPADLIVTVVDPSGTRRTLPHPVTDYKIVPARFHPPGIIDTNDRILFWNEEMDQLVFPSPGVYTIETRMLLAKLPKEVVAEAAPLQITVQPEAAVDQDAIATLGSPELLVTLLRQGPLWYCQGRDHKSCLADLDTFLEVHRKSSYAPHICLRIASSLRAELLDVEDSHARAIDLGTSFGEKWPDHPLIAKSMELVALELAHEGRLLEAREWAERYESEWPARTSTAKVVRNAIGE